jgi:hypothetical protein
MAILRHSATKCHIFTVMFFAFMLNGIMLNVVFSSVVAPGKGKKDILLWASKLVVFLPLSKTLSYKTFLTKIS